MKNLVEDTGKLDGHHLAARIQDHLALEGIPGGWVELTGNGHTKGSAVLFLITPRRMTTNGPPEPCLLLNKRSADVLQPGDLCCPGGGVGRFDKILARLMHWPLSPLRRWPLWKSWQSSHPDTANELATLLTTGLREGWEEMRLNPLKVMFLGCLPVQNLIMFERHIYPLVGWLENHRNLVPNWEVERIIHIPLRRLVDPENYGCYKLIFQNRQNLTRRQEHFPCFVHQGRNGREVLWGATFRITMDFLRMVFGFRVPDLKGAQVIEKQLGETYLNGSLMQERVDGHLEQDDDF